MRDVNSTVAYDHLSSRIVFVYNLLCEINKFAKIVSQNDQDFCCIIYFIEKIKRSFSIYIYNSLSFPCDILLVCFEPMLAVST